MKTTTKKYIYNVHIYAFKNQMFHLPKLLKVFGILKFIINIIIFLIPFYIFLII